MDDIGRLHGAALDEILVHWRNGNVRLTFLGGHHPHSVRATGLTSLVVPRSGGGRVKSAVATEGVFELVMESGETLRIEAASFAFHS